jgi:4-amino-4-deoxy-L-arabinose transferase-like glycosyltransferase
MAMAERHRRMTADGALSGHGEAIDGRRASRAIAKLSRTFQVWPQVRTVLLLSGYPLVQLLIRLAISDALEYDEAQQLVLTQSLALGYEEAAAQPPLYTWLQVLFFKVFGMNLFALGALRALLQILTQVALFRSAYLILGDRTLALLAALSLWLIPQFSIESMRKTHSVLVTCLAALFLHALLLVWTSGGVGAYLWFGAVLAFGALAKYNFAIFGAALLLAAVWVASLRRRLTDRRLGLGLVMAAVVVAPHLIWVLQHLAAVSTQIGDQLDVWPETRWSITSALHSLLSLGEAPLGYLPPVALHIAVFGRPREGVSSTAASAARLVERFWLLGFGILTVAVLVFVVPTFHEHWLQPFLFVLPLYMFLRQPSASPGCRGIAVFTAVLGTALVLFAGWRLMEPWAGHHFGAYSRLNAPYRELARGIAETGFRDGVIITDHHIVGGNLRFVLKDAKVITRRMSEGRAIIPPGPCLIVWDARGRVEIPPELDGWVATSGRAAPPVRYVEARGRRAERAPLRLGFILLPTCRR